MGSDQLHAKFQVAYGLVLIAAPIAVNILHAVSLIAGAISLVCGAIIGVHGVHRIYKGKAPLVRLPPEEPR